ncbi:MAG: tRNA (adenosine(37)-N6)-threonylcarbamoyltransferase complex transferase subunit TsaD [bacterium]
MTCIIGIETSCDETAAAIVKDGREIVSSQIHSQSVHALYGGVVPDLSSREHVKLIDRIVNKTLQNAGLSAGEIDAVAVNNGPGLILSLMPGVMFAKGFAMAAGKPLISIDHIESHIYAIELSNDRTEYPMIVLVASGGHTTLFEVDIEFNMHVLGSTMDDAAGEAYDKCGKMLGFDYPAGPRIDRESDDNADFADFPVSRLKGYDFSYSGLKTAVMYYLRDKDNETLRKNRNSIAASVQKAINDQLIDRISKAVRNRHIENIGIAGGVAANSDLRKRLGQYADRSNIKLFMPAKKLCTDNAAGTAGLAYRKFLRGGFDDMSMDVYTQIKKHVI